MAKGITEVSVSNENQNHRLDRILWHFSIDFNAKFSFRGRRAMNALMAEIQDFKKSGTGIYLSVWLRLRREEMWFVYISVIS